MSKYYPRLSSDQTRNQRILLEFTKELIRNSGEDLYLMQKVFHFDARKYFETHPEKSVSLPVQEQNRESNKEDIDVAVEKLESEYEPSLKFLSLPKESFRPNLGKIKLTIPEPSVPKYLQYLKPVPTDQNIDLGKLNPLVKDPQVRTIDCPGPNENVLVSGTMGTKRTGIMMNKEQISEVVEIFSKAAKIPSHEGVFKVVVGRLIFLAIISETIGSKFTIKKMIFNATQSTEIPAPRPSQ